LKGNDREITQAVQSSLDMQHFPRLEYQLEELLLREQSTNDPPSFVFLSRGALTIHGVTNRVEFPVTVESPREGWLSLLGVLKFNLNEFGVAPPQIGPPGAALSAGVDLQITLDWKLQRASPLKPRLAADQ
jgi:hypothetical protein